MSLLPRNRIINAISFRSPSTVPLRIFAAPGGSYEHGQKLVDLIKDCGHDFGDFNDLTLPKPPAPEDFDTDGSYHAIKTDEWGTTWEYRIFGVWGHPIGWPLNDLDELDNYKAPQPPSAEGEEFEKAKTQADIHRQRYYLLSEGGSIFEKLHSLRRFEDVLVDIMLDTPQINRIADIIVQNVEGHVRKSLALDADAVAFGDDFGTQTSLLLSLDVWRKFFKPRYKAIFDPVVKAGKKVFFHCCGQMNELFEDLKDIGVDVIWPQLPLYDLSELAHRCRDLELAVELHPDRGDLMQKGKPEDVRKYLHNLVKTFDTISGGSWLYIEIDPGFPWANVQALFKAAMDLRS